MRSKTIAERLTGPQERLLAARGRGQFVDRFFAAIISKNLSATPSTLRLIR